MNSWNEFERYDFSFIWSAFSNFLSACFLRYSDHVYPRSNCKAERATQMRKWLFSFLSFLRRSSFIVFCLHETAVANSVNLLHSFYWHYLTSVSLLCSCYRCRKDEAAECKTKTSIHQGTLIRQLMTMLPFAFFFFLLLLVSLCLCLCEFYL